MDQKTSTTPKWNQFLLDCFESQEAVDQFQQSIGHALIESPVFRGRLERLVEDVLRRHSPDSPNRRG